MLRYKPQLKNTARRLRNNMTDAENLLWSKFRRKQVLGLQFYRQKPLGPYIVDFYAPSVKLVVEVDGSQHMEISHANKDVERDRFLNKQGLKVLRFDNLQVLNEIESVLAIVYAVVEAKLEIPPNPPLQRGESGSANRQGEGGSAHVPDHTPSQRALNTEHSQAESTQCPRPESPPLSKGG